MRHLTAFELSLTALQTVTLEGLAGPTVAVLAGWLGV
jgi:hypothetical protein